MIKYNYLLIILLVVLAGVAFYFISNDEVAVPPIETPIALEKDIIKKYVEDNIKTLAPEPAVLGGSWYTTNVEIDPISKTGKALYEDGHIVGEMVFNYLFRDDVVLIGGINGRDCYEYNHNATVNEPYTVKENIDITRTNGDVVGIKSGTQEGPDMTNGYTGTLTGNVNKDIMDVIFSYIIEGSPQKEKELYNVKDDALIKFHYVLKEERGVLVPDLDSTPKQIVYKKVSCSSI